MTIIIIQSTIMNKNGGGKTMLNNIMTGKKAGKNK
jgi:hypothetical protein